MNIVKLWAVVSREKDYSRDCTAFTTPYIDVYHSIYSTENEAKQNKKYGQSYKEVVAIDLGDSQFTIIGLVENAMKLS